MRRSERIAGWRSDLELLASELPVRHKRAFHTVDEGSWRRAVSELDARLPQLNNACITVELARLVAMLGDAHTSLRRRSAERYPISFYDFSDGIHVVAAPHDAAWAVGAKLVGVGATSIEVAHHKLAPIVSRENDARLAMWIPILLTDPPIVAGAGLVSNVARATYRLAVADGSIRDLELAPTPAPSVAPSRPSPPPGEVPLWLSDIVGPYWYACVAERRLLYFQYNRCEDSLARPFAACARDALAQIDREAIDTVVIDLRHNGGGNSEVIRPLLIGLAMRPRLAGRVYAAIGRETFSSGVLAAIELLHQGAILAGEATSGRPSCYGETKLLTLPFSGIPISYSTKYFSYRDLDGDTLAPHIAAPLSSTDWSSGKDPVLAAIFAARSA